MSQLIDGKKISAQVKEAVKQKNDQYKPKKDSKRKMGHRQPYTKLKIEAINA